MGEGTGQDEAIMPWIDEASIACGYHAGDAQTMWETLALTVKHNVKAGAHVSFFDRVNFGRTETKLPLNEVYELVQQQLIILDEVAGSLDIELYHVKPHGALYNMSARDAMLAKTIAEAVRDYNPSLVLFGLSGSHSVTEANKAGLITASEVFADRSYQDDGSLTPRSHPGALIDSVESVTRQVLQMIKDGSVTTISNKIIPITAGTICIHGDGPHAAAFAKAIHQAIQTA